MVTSLSSQSRWITLKAFHLGLAALLVGALGLATTGQAAAAAPCDVTSARRLSTGGDQDWSRANDLIVHDRMDAAGIFQLHTIKPDGSGQRCLTCAARAGAPRGDRHKNNPTWHPSGRFIVLQGEMDSHPLWWARDKYTAELILNGLWSNLYATTADGKAWYRLTDYSSTQADGAMAPRFSADGSKLLWSRMAEPAGQDAPWGKWRLMLADFVVGANGTPSLQNVRDITPSNGGLFFESHGFSPDGRQVIFTSDRGTTHKWGLDLWAMDLAGGALINLTSSPNWEEHAQYTPDGRLITYMSSKPYDVITWLTAGLIPTGTELFVMNADGSRARQVTHFNVGGYPESDTRRLSFPSRTSWSADGKRLAVTRQLAGSNYPARELWMLTFAGACGGSDPGPVPSQARRGAAPGRAAT